MPNIDNLTLSEIERKGLTHLLGKKRAAKKRVGRPRKPIDKHQQFSMTYWYGLIVKEYPHLRPVQRSRIALECWKILANKINTLPTSPEDSVLNTNDAMAMLKDLEAGKPILDEKPSEQEPTI